MQQRVLVINFFPAFYPPTSGGELRYFNFYNELSKFHDITMLSPTYSHEKFEVINHNDHFREYRVPKEVSIHDTLHMKLDQENIGREFSAIVCALSAKYPNRFHEVYLDLYEKCNLIIHESPYMLEYDLFFGLDNKPRIYNSYNHETVLIKQTLTGKNSVQYIDMINKLEKRLVENSDLVFAISDEEKRSFHASYDVDEFKIKLAPNGIIPDQWDRLETSNQLKNKTAFFIGSSHPPNLEALDFIINTLSEKCPQIDFIIAGSCCDSFINVRKHNVKLMGRVDEDTKNNLFAKCDIAINPMFSGAGTNLKTLEYLAAGIPLISTEFGIRGIGIEDGLHYLSATKENFHQKLQTHDNEKLKQISINAKEYISNHYSWKGIVNNIINNINEVLVNIKVKDKKMIFLLNDYEVSNPISGGEIRINKLYTNLSNEYNIILLCLSNSNEIKMTPITNSFIQLAIPKTEEHLQEEINKSSIFWVSTVDIVASNMVKRNKLLKLCCKEIYNLSDLVIVNHPYIYPILEGLDGKPVIYESHNAEFTLKSDVLEGHPLYEQLIQKIYELEGRLCNNSDLIISVSDDDHSELRKLIYDKSKEIITIKNGVSILEMKYEVNVIKKMFNGYPVVLFLGSAHLPNVEALKYIINELAPKISAYFIIIGSVCDAYSSDVPSNVLFFGKLDEVHKDFLMNLADLAINPMQSGSGSNLKLADYMSHRLPTVTTYFGARGYEIEDNKHAIICEISEFPKKLESLIKSDELQKSLSMTAFEYVKSNLSWDNLARQMSNILKSKIFGKVTDKKRLLVLTYRFTEPPLGGAETYLLNIVKQIDKLGDFSIDVVTMNIYDIYNKFHFSNTYTLDNSLSFTDSKNTSIYKFSVDNIEESKQYNNSQKLFDNWMSESVKLSLQFLSSYQGPLLLGGWFYPEKNGNKYEIWSSSESIVYTKDIEIIEISGHSPSKRKLKISSSNKVIFEKVVDGSFNVHLRLSKFEYITLNIDPYYVENIDPRGLGVRVTSIKGILGDQPIEIPLDYDYKSYLKENYYEQFIQTLIEVAKNRNPQYDELFQITRGPTSKEMNSWLENNISNYDVVLGHSVPFHTSVKAAELKKAYNKPVIILPHFHIDDEFYHWNSYYLAFKAADRVIAAPKTSVPLFYDKLGVKSLYLPGGAINEDEYLEVTTESFKKRYTSDLPFVLVLGRKARAKNYKWVVEAVDKINANGKKCNLVIIGKDEDGDKIDSKDTIYFGEMTRHEVLGALKECKCLVTMSESESFGIVILEAWMLKKPVIVNEKCTAFIELVDNGINGLTCNKEDLHEKINYLLENETACEEMGRKGFESVSNLYTWESLGNEFNKLLLDVSIQKK